MLSLLFPSIKLIINLTTSRFDLYSNVDNFNSADIKIDILIIIASISILSFCAEMPRCSEESYLLISSRRINLKISISENL